MNTTKKINVNFSSLVSLKAELLKKQAEVNEIQLKNESINRLPQNRKRKGKDEEKITKKLIDSDIASHKKIKLMLEAKTRLYEKLKKSRNNHDNFLVDFENKLHESDEEFVDEEINEKYPIESEENWVEYQDCFGRTRKCLQKDLSYMQNKNELLKQEIMKKNGDTDKEEENKNQFSIQANEPEIEIMRRKWEEQRQKLVDKVDIHYQDVLFDEVRTHGVAYYAFSQDKDERAKQQENLTNLRKETERKQREVKEIKGLKERMELNRLKTAKLRQRIRAGLPAEPTEEELAQESKINFVDNNCAKTNNELAKIDTTKSSEETASKSISTEKINTLEKENNDEDEDKIKLFEKLLYKKNWHVMSQEEWIHKCRTQRINKFGPVYNNSTNTGVCNGPPSIGKESVHKDNGNNNLKIYNPKNFIEKSTTELKSCENYDNSVNTTSLSNSQSSQIQPPAFYTSSRLSNNNLQNVCSNLSMPVHEQEEMNELHIPLPNKDKTISASSDNLIHKSRTLSQNMTEDKIMAGLKYLRKKFEETHK